MSNIVVKAVQFFPSLIRWKKEAKRLSDVDFFEFNELLKGGFVTPRFFNAVSLYGNFKAISNLTHRSFNFLVDYLEHGVCFYDTPESTTLMGYATRPGIKNIYTFSEHRKGFIEQYLKSKGIRKHVHAVGPYIMGAGNFLPEESLEAIKKRFGRILLVYPSHSIDNVIAQYDATILIEEIERRAVDFDSVFVCMYWKDLVDEQRRQQYSDKGYIIVCNGLGSDPHFLSRQKDIMMLSDLVMTNGLGTHIGYAVCLQRPVYFFQQYKCSTDGHGKVLKVNNNFVETEKMFADAFRDYSFDITQEQIELVEKFWGKW